MKRNAVLFYSLVIFTLIFNSLYAFNSDFAHPAMLSEMELEVRHSNRIVNTTTCADNGVELVGTNEESKNSNYENSFTVAASEIHSFHNCSIDAQISNVYCNPINAEWTQLTFDYELTAENPPGGWLAQMSFALNQGGDPDLVFAGGNFPANGVGSILIPAGETTSNIVFFIPSFDCGATVGLTCAPVPDGEIDLELSLIQSTNDPSPFTNYSVTASIINGGPETATGVSVEFPKPAGVVYQGGNEFDTSQGTFNPNGNQIWTVGSLPSGATATLTVNFFLLAPEDPLSYAQVRSANENDMDSSPDNGTPPLVNEDDEARTGGGLEICKIQADLLEIYCDDQGTPDNGEDDTFTLDLTAEITEGSACGNVFNYEGESAPYGTSIEIGPFNVNSSNSFITVTDSETSAFDNLSIPGNFGNCNNLEEACEGNILPNPGFELVFSNWVLLSTVSNTTQSFAGTAALQAQTGAEERAMYQLIDIAAGQSYEVSSYVNENNGDASIYYQYLDAAGNLLLEPTMQVTSSGVWDQYTSTSTAPAGAVSMEVGGRASAQTQVIFDAFCVRPVEPVDLPDLILTDLNIDNPIVNTGDLLSYSFRIDNLGSGVPLGSVSVRAYFSADDILSNDDVLGGNISTELTGTTEFPIGPLEGGTEMSQGLLSPGAYFLILKVDEIDVFEEENENNNIVVGTFMLNDPFEVLIDCPADLTVQIPFYEGVPQPCTNGSGIPLPSYEANCPGPIDLQVSTNVLAGNLNIGPLEGNACGPLFTTGEGTVEVTFTALACAGLSSSCTFQYTQEYLDPTEENIDLELTLFQPNPNPSQWNNYSLVATLTNNGPLDATGIVVDFPAPQGVVYVGAAPFNAEQGTFSPFSTELWNVGTLPAGSSTTLTVNYFLLAPEVPATYAQVQSANENDTDSTPGNGTPPTVNEDDEASTDEETTIEFAVFDCPESPSLDGLAENEYSATFNWSPPTATTDCVLGGLTITQIEGPNPGSTFFPTPSGTPIVYQITDACGNEEICVFFVFVNPESSQLICPDNITVVATSESGATVNYDPPTTVSFCDGIPGPADLSSGLPSGSEFPIGTIQVFRQILLLGPAAFCQVTVSCTFEVTVLPQVTDPLPDLNFSNYELTNPMLQAGETLHYEIDLFNTGDAPASDNFSIKTYISTDDQLSPDDNQRGIIPTGYWPVGFAELSVEGTASIPSDLSPGDYFLILKLDAEEEIIESEEANNTGVLSFTVLPDDEGDPCDDILVTLNPGSITLTNMTAPILIQKIFDPYWNTVLNCSGTDCQDPVTTGGLVAGTYFISIRLFDQNWVPICDYEEYVDVPPAAQASAFIQQAAQGLPVEIHSLRPNPSKNGRVEVMIFAQENRSQELRCYNLYGSLEAKYDLNLVEGWNIIPVNINGLTSGTYYFQLPGQHIRQMPIRLVVIRE